MKQSPDFSALQSAFESLSDPVAVLNQEGIIQYINPGRSLEQRMIFFQYRGKVLIICRLGSLNWIRRLS